MAGWLSYNHYLKGREERFLVLQPSFLSLCEEVEGREGDDRHQPFQCLFFHLHHHPVFHISSSKYICDGCSLAVPLRETKIESDFFVCKIFTLQEKEIIGVERERERNECIPSLISWLRHISQDLRFSTSILKLDSIPGSVLSPSLSFSFTLTHPPFHPILCWFSSFLLLPACHSFTQ